MPLRATMQMNMQKITGQSRRDRSRQTPRHAASRTGRSTRWTKSVTGYLGGNHLTGSPSITSSATAKEKPARASDAMSLALYGLRSPER